MIEHRNNSAGKDKGVVQKGEADAAEQPVDKGVKEEADTVEVPAEEPSNCKDPAGEVGPVD